jgi:hypothetical protein
MRKIILLVVLMNQLIFAQGLILDSVEYEKIEKWEPKEEFGYVAPGLPKSISYRKFTPEILNQGEVSTCVGWAVSYAHLSTQQNILMNVTDETHKIFRAMDPNFVYSLIRGHERYLV